MEQEWQPRNEEKVVLRLQIKRWLPIKLPINQNIPVDYERPLKAIIQKHTTHKNAGPLLSKPKTEEQ